MSSSTYRFSLQSQENAGGHTIAKHVGKDQAWLTARLTREPSIPYASTFFDLSTAEKHVEDGIKANLIAIGQWMSQTQLAVRAFDYNAGVVVGEGVERATLTLRQMTRLRLILRRTSSPPDCFVLTAFPIL